MLVRHCDKPVVASIEMAAQLVRKSMSCAHFYEFGVLCEALRRRFWCVRFDLRVLRSSPRALCTACGDCVCHHRDPDRNLVSEIIFNADSPILGRMIPDQGIMVPISWTVRMESDEFFVPIIGFRGVPPWGSLRTKIRAESSSNGSQL